MLIGAPYKATGIGDQHRHRGRADNGLTRFFRLALARDVILKTNVMGGPNCARIYGPELEAVDKMLTVLANVLDLNGATLAFRQCLTKNPAFGRI
jgi:hypothetical protein